MLGKPNKAESKTNEYYTFYKKVEIAVFHTLLIKVTVTVRS